jgi:hypothetical protein
MIHKYSKTHNFFETHLNSTIKNLCIFQFLKKNSKLCEAFQIVLMWFLKFSIKWMEIILDISFNMMFQMAIMYVIHTFFAKKTFYNYNILGNVFNKLKMTQCWQGFNLSNLDPYIQNSLWFPIPKVIAHWGSLVKVSSCTLHALPFHLEGMCLESCPCLAFSLPWFQFTDFT